MNVLVELVRKEDVSAVAAEYQHLFAQDPDKYGMKIDKDPVQTKQAPEPATFVLQDESERLYVVRSTSQQLIGYVKGEVIPATECIPCQDVPGYRDYQNIADTLNIDRFEVFEPGNGVGSATLRRLQQEPFELIDLQAKGERLKKFYEKNGFIDTTLNDGEHDILVWNNPAYRQN